MIYKSLGLILFFFTSLCMAANSNEQKLMKPLDQATTAVVISPGEQSLNSAKQFFDGANYLSLQKQRDEQLSDFMNDQELP